MNLLSNILRFSKFPFRTIKWCYIIFFYFYCFVMINDIPRFFKFKFIEIDEFLCFVNLQTFPGANLNITLSFWSLHTSVLTSIWESLSQHNCKLLTVENRKRITETMDLILTEFIDEYYRTNGKLFILIIKFHLIILCLVCM